MLTDLHPQVIYSNKCLQIELDVNAGFIHVDWLRHPSSQEFRRLYQKAADLSFEYNCRYWLSDASAIHYLEIADQNWMLREMAPRLTTTSLAKYARVMRQESMIMMDVQRVYDILQDSPYLDKRKTQIELFQDKVSALKWLFPQDVCWPGQQLALQQEDKV